MQDPADSRDESRAHDNAESSAGMGAHAISAAIVEVPQTSDELSDTMPRRAITHEDLAVGSVGPEISTSPTGSSPDAAPKAIREMARTGDREEEDVTVGEDALHDDRELTLPRRLLPIKVLTEPAMEPGQSMFAELPYAFPDAILPHFPPGKPTSVATELMQEQALIGVRDEPAPTNAGLISELESTALDREIEPLPANTEMAGYPTHVVLAEEPEQLSGEDEPAPATVIAEPAPEQEPAPEPEQELLSMVPELEPTAGPHAFEQSQPYSAALVQAAPDLLEAYTAPATEPALTAAVPPTESAPFEIPPLPPLSTPYGAPQPVRETRAAEPTVPLYEEPPPPVLPPVVDVSGIYSRVPPAYWIHEDPLEDTRYHLGLTGSRPIVREAGRPLPKPRRFRRPARWRSFLMLVIVSVLIAFACGAALSIGVETLTRPPAAPTAVPTHTITPKASPSPRQ